MSDLVLHNYYRSSTSYRVRIALEMKGLTYQYVPHHLRHGEHLEPAYLSVNPQGLVPALILGDGTLLTQSLAIIEFLNETWPEPPLLPQDALGRARVRMLAQMIACDIHPVNNLRVLTSLRTLFGAGDEDVANWFRHWVNEGFQPLEKILASSSETGTFCHDDTPGLADICLVAQVTSNARFGVDMTPYPTITRIHAACMALPAFQKAAPENQIDAE
ncbi:MULTISPECIES: maleylacetoacetate isomerase [unclassified Mesorhizobium]|uniref:maleylacetoacetate isomerase n=1 Tax=unclassified Mesorhizobium TaxID=325217 RepID=UPI000FCCD52F|nr:MULTISPECIES: maleylacetoacetate isomerase [unclassified Mesorhizobium]RUU45143.1 maleylacetoacetate isomerase [Mesorhizobium sp. M6A.T.Ca.TU.002.02.2.1]RUU26864.1 maleylacetoacetate isomerase [Mesorhizobium sp. M6A.T.Ce.TU.016.01.1.1]RVB75120.1 maleylacetoacetate isomerase [Mesorhizobium sp. M6A.T.Cr.TU.014.01.1.1]RWQ05336.1 MAG: maleylacetoacetate isomerase [Mesorhizobium sp.]RWQ11513.1 MAG: maleylacetoacetate isomerase [Mesorhizobium sp.]